MELILVFGVWINSHSITKLHEYDARWGGSGCVVTLISNRVLFDNKTCDEVAKEIKEKHNANN